MTSTPKATPLGWTFKAWMVAEVLFGLAALVTVFLRPQDSATNFAWPIKPDVTAAVLGAFYASTVLLFVLPLFARYWQQVRVVALPAAGFTLMMLVATFLHWEKFRHASLPFWVWFLSYLLPPPIFLSFYFGYQRRAEPVGGEVTSPWPRWAGRLLFTNGLVFTAAALLVFAAPTLVADLAPWKLTPLTTRTLCGWLVAVGLLQISIAREGEWWRARIGATMLLLLPFTLALQLGRFTHEVSWGNALLWVMLVDFVAVAAVTLLLWRSERAA